MSPAASSDIGADASLHYTLPPAEVRVKQHGRVLELVWRDRIAQTLSAESLRSLCRCAECKSARKRAALPARYSDVVIADVQPCGAGALNLHFNDGHRRGIYPFAWLASITAAATREDFDS